MRIGLCFAMKKTLKHIIFIVLVLVTVSCGIEGDKAPESIIPGDIMVKVITEIELTQALLKLKIANQDTVNQKQLFNETFKEFGVSEDEFNNSLKYYCQDPKLLEEIYVKVINNISKKQAKNQ
jgi:hypothetical protein